MRRTADTVKPPRVAWTGGSPPPAYTVSPPGRRLLISEIFREQLQDFIYYWHELPNLDTARISWNRAKHDAHATIRSYMRQTH
jgi:hypothetical protein